MTKNDFFNLFIKVSDKKSKKEYLNKYKGTIIINKRYKSYNIRNGRNEL